MVFGVKLIVPKTVIPAGSKAVVVACGNDEGLGRWNPGSAYILKRVKQDSEEWVFDEFPANVADGCEFKYVVIAGKGQVQWEANRPNRQLFKASTAIVHHFDKLERKEQEAAAYLRVKSELLKAEAFERDHKEQQKQHKAPSTSAREIRVIVDIPIGGFTGTSTGSSVYACGSCPYLGNWDTKHAARLEQSASQSGEWILKFSKEKIVSPGCEFKFLIMDSRNPDKTKWEANRPNRTWPAESPKSAFVFDELEKEEISSMVSAQELRVIADLSTGGDTGTPTGSSVYACGGCPFLGNWVARHAAPLEQSASKSDEWILKCSQGKVVPSGCEFKFVIMDPRNPFKTKWEANRPNREWPTEIPKAAFIFDKLEEEEERQMQAKAAPAQQVQLRRQPRGKRPRIPAPGPEIIVTWGNEATIGGISCLEAGRPSTIFHAFHWPFRAVTKMAQTIAEGGFDAVQLSPAQKSISGSQWWTRYQPVRYDEIHGLGSESELKEACGVCGERGIRVLGDLVFNHMLVVAPCHEWRRAQDDEKLLENLKKRLEAAVAPVFDRNDFEWPWFCLEEEHWDGPKRMEGWGCGEWSELKGGSPKVVAVHTAHMERLRSCGVSGFRYDAVKHIRPAHIWLYLKALASNGAFSYGEVLSVDAKMHEEYTKVNVHSEPFATTDFPLAVWLRTLLEHGEEADLESLIPGRTKLLEGQQDKEQKTSNPANTIHAPLLARNSVRFSRNHDTVHGGQSYYGLGGWSPESAAIATAWLLAVHDGSVLILAEDVDKCDLIKRAAIYRKELRKRLTNLTSAEKESVSTDIRVRKAQDAGEPPLTVVIACRLKTEVLGFCVFNPDLCPGPPVDFHASDCLASSTDRSKFRSIGQSSKNSSFPSEIEVYAHGFLTAPLQIPAGDGLFYLAAQD